MSDMTAHTAVMTARTLRAVLKRHRESRGWTHAEMAADIHALIGVPVVSKDTLRLFLTGAKVSPRIAGVLTDYVAKRASSAWPKAS